MILVKKIHYFYWFYILLIISKFCARNGKNVPEPVGTREIGILLSMAGVCGGVLFSYANLIHIRQEDRFCGNGGDV